MTEVMKPTLNKDNARRIIASYGVADSALDIYMSSVEVEAAKTIQGDGLEVRGNTIYLSGIVVPASDVPLLRYLGFECFSDKCVRDALEKVDGQVNLAINSPGGATFTGSAIIAALSSKDYTSEIQGLAASMAGIIAVSAKTCAMHPTAMMMLHPPWTITIGNAKQLRKDADVLDKIASTFKSLTAKRGLDKDRVDAIFDDESWFTAEEAVAESLADSIIGETEQAEDNDVKSMLEAANRYEGRRLLHAMLLE